MLFRFTSTIFTSQLLPSALIPDNSVCVWGLQATGANDNIVVKTFGTAPNRQYWIFFTSYSIPGNTAGWTYWSIVLEETSNKIYLVDQRTKRLVEYVAWYSIEQHHSISCCRFTEYRNSGCK
ncbi:MAG: hypothetical protein IPP34_08130 [Bacteroidetes bacterium]|nr:hypothetical protein [Bacteroidota bacterium]